MNRSDLQHPSIVWESAACSHVGTVRTVNEDAYLDRPDLGLWAVADGMGGHQAGDVASRTIVDALGGMRSEETRDGLLLQLRERLLHANAALLKLAAERRDGAVIGSTVAILAGFNGQAICLWVGDSRIYLCRNRELRQLTRDHSQVEELIRLGLLDREEAESHPQSNIVTRAVGAHEELKIDVVAGTMHEGDVYLICSDGLNKVLEHDEIASILQSGSSGQSSRKLVERAVEQGARDNVTAVVVTVSPPRPEAESGPEAQLDRAGGSREAAEPEEDAELRDHD